MVLSKKIKSWLLAIILILQLQECKWHSEWPNSFHREASLFQTLLLFFQIGSNSVWYFIHGQWITFSKFILNSFQPRILFIRTQWAVKCISSKVFGRIITALNENIPIQWRKLSGFVHYMQIPDLLLIVQHLNDQQVHVLCSGSIGKAWSPLVEEIPDSDADDSVHTNHLACSLLSVSSNLQLAKNLSCSGSLPWNPLLLFILFFLQEELSEREWSIFNSVLSHHQRNRNRFPRQQQLGQGQGELTYLPYRPLRIIGLHYLRVYYDYYYS